LTVEGNISGGAGIEKRPTSRGEIEVQANYGESVVESVVPGGRKRLTSCDETGNQTDGGESAKGNSVVDLDRQYAIAECIRDPSSTKRRKVR
jgi:hypothetical protein